MMADIERLDMILDTIENVYSDYPRMKAALSEARDLVDKIRDDLDGLAFNEKHLRKDCERLRRELDDEMGIIR